MLAQLCGALLGVFAAFYFFNSRNTVLTLYKNYFHGYRIVQCMISEIFGSFLLTLAYLTQTEKKYRLCEDEILTLLIISASYVVAMGLSNPVGFFTT